MSTLTTVEAAFAAKHGALTPSGQLENGYNIETVAVANDREALRLTKLETSTKLVMIDGQAVQKTVGKIKVVAQQLL